MKREELLDELSDAMWYAAITAEGSGTTLDMVMQHNV